MSAYIVPRPHIDLLVAAGCHEPPRRPGLKWCGPDGWKTLDPRYAGADFELTTVDEVGRMLWLENVESVAFRYPDDGPNDRPGPSDFCDMVAELYEWTDPRYRLVPGEILNAVGCYEYQSCEHPGWRASEAYAYCDALRRAASEPFRAGPYEWTAEELVARVGSIQARRQLRVV